MSSARKLYKPRQVGYLIGFEMVVCPSCHKESRAELWDKNTYNSCKTRALRREYISFCSVHAWKYGRNNNESLVYRCPCCNMFQDMQQISAYNKDFLGG